MELFVNKNYPLVDTRRNAYIFSGLLILISLLLFFFRGLNYGVDFVGGTSIEVKFSSKVELEKVRSIVSSKYSSDRIQDFGNGNEVLIHVLEQNNDVAPTVLKLMNDNF
ncbi:MAG TPA: hypothetical protein PLL93_13665, partial [bacterium]|nr:hypothetical protein [bacterium]